MLSDIRCTRTCILYNCTNIRSGYRETTSEQFEVQVSTSAEVDSCVSGDKHEQRLESVRPGPTSSALAFVLRSPSATAPSSSSSASASFNESAAGLLAMTAPSVAPASSSYAAPAAYEYVGYSAATAYAQSLSQAQSGPLQQRIQQPQKQQKQQHSHTLSGSGSGSGKKASRERSPLASPFYVVRPMSAPRPSPPTADSDATHSVHAALPNLVLYPCS